MEHSNQSGDKEEEEEVGGTCSFLLVSSRNRGCESIITTVGNNSDLTAVITVVSLSSSWREETSQSLMMGQGWDVVTLITTSRQ